MSKSLRSTLFFFISIAAFSIYLWTRPPGPGPAVDPRLQPFLDEWQADMDREGIDVRYPIGRLRSLKFGEVGSGFVGVSNKKDNTIVLSDRLIDQGEYVIRAAVYHELGHFVFDLKHVGYFSIMNGEVLRNWQYEDRWESMKNEYLNHCKENYDIFKFR